MADQQKGLGERTGNVAHSDADTGNPIKIGGRVRLSPEAATSSNDRTDAIFTSAGALTIAGSNGGNPTHIEVTSNGNLEVHSQGNVGNDTAEGISFPVGMGHTSREFAADPAQVSADNDRVRSIATAQGIQWTLGGHPNILRREWMTTAAQTDDEIIATVPAGSHVVLTAISVVASAAGSTTPQFRIGFGTASVPAEPASGASVVGIVASHGGVAAGSGIVEGNGSGVIAVGGSDEELRITNAVPTGGKITVVVSYYISTL